MTPAEPVVVDRPEQGRFTTGRDGLVAQLVYRQQGDRLVLVHTEVPEQISGEGIGGYLMNAAIERAAQDSLTVVPWCPYARKWLAKHPDEAARVQIDWESKPPGARSA